MSGITCQEIMYQQFYNEFQEDNFQGNNIFIMTTGAVYRCLDHVTHEEDINIQVDSQCHGNYKQNAALITHAQHSELCPRSFCTKR